MSKADIMAELPKLPVGDRREIFECICEMDEQELLKGGEPSPQEKAMLDRELEEYRLNPDAGSPWEEVEARLRSQSRQ